MLIWSQQVQSTGVEHMDGLKQQKARLCTDKSRLSGWLHTMIFLPYVKMIKKNKLKKSRMFQGWGHQS